MGYWEYPAFIVFGLMVGTYGTLVGLGGGFVIVPVLLLVLKMGHEQAAGTSLAVVFLNAVSASFSYIRQKRVDFKSGIKFAIATVPGAIAGPLVSTHISSALFNLIFGILLVVASAFLMWRPEVRQSPDSDVRIALGRGRVTRRLVDTNGNIFAYTFNERVGVVISFFAGFLSSILGIGGGVVHVPAMIHLFSFPAHIATATSQFILVITSGVGAASHLSLGDVRLDWAIAMGIGVIIGAQYGAALSKRLQGSLIIRLLSLALVVTGLRLALSGLGIWK